MSVRSSVLLAPAVILAVTGFSGCGNSANDVAQSLAHTNLTGDWEGTYAAQGSTYPITAMIDDSGAPVTNSILGSVQIGTPSGPVSFTFAAGPFHETFFGTVTFAPPTCPGQFNITGQNFHSPPAADVLVISLSPAGLGPPCAAVPMSTNLTLTKISPLAVTRSAGTRPRLFFRYPEGAAEIGWIVEESAPGSGWYLGYDGPGAPPSPLGPEVSERTALASGVVLVMKPVPE